MSAKALDVMVMTITNGTATQKYLFRGQKETYTDLGLSATESGVDATPSEEDSFGARVRVGDLLRSGLAVRVVASGKTSTGKTVTRRLIVPRQKAAAVISDINSRNPSVDGAEMSATFPVRRRIV